jgi:hypothetical protein
VVATEKCGSKIADKADNVDIWMGSLIVRSCLQRMSIIGMQNLVGMKVSNFKKAFCSTHHQIDFLGLIIAVLDNFITFFDLT